MKNNLLFTIFTLLFTSTIFSQVAINTTGAVPASSAMLDVTSTNKGMRIPRMTSNERKAIQNPDMGLLVYDTDRQTIYLFDGVEWKAMMAGSENKLPLISRSPQGAYEFSSFGEAAAIYGNYAVVGAPTDTANGKHSGAAYVFAKENGAWVQQAKLFSTNGEDGDKFGSSVDIYDDMIIVGAPNKAISGAAGKGRVYIFKRTNKTWNQVIGLQASNGVVNDNFGASISFNGKYVIVGAPYSDFNGVSDIGAVYVFGLINNVWSQNAFLHASNSAASANFGHSVSLHGTTLVVGAPFGNGGAAKTGAVYVFKNTDQLGFTWIQNQMLEATSLGQSMFGESVSVYGNTILVGAPLYSNVSNANIGLVSKFTFNNVQWVNSQTYSINQAYLYTGSTVVTDGVTDIYSIVGWDNSKGKVGLTSDSRTRYLTDDNPDLSRTYGWKLDFHNGQVVITAKDNSLMNRNGTVYFGIID